MDEIHQLKPFTLSPFGYAHERLVEGQYADKWKSAPLENKLETA